MKVYRYMSIEEFVKMSMGIDMKANVNQQFDKNNTDSKGFCFLSSKTIGKSKENNSKTYEFSAEECLEFISGVVTDEILVEFEDNNISEWHLGYGEYSNPMENGRMEINEYSLLKYSKEILKPLRYVISPNSVNIQDNIWEEFLPEKEYTIRDMITSFVGRRTSPYTDKSLTFKDDLKVLPPMPNTNSDNIWRILEDDIEGIDKLVYGNPITEEDIYVLTFDDEKGEINFGENIPEFWEPLKTLYDNNPNLSKSHMDVFYIATLIAEYPEILDRFELYIEDDTAFYAKFGPNIYLKNNDITLDVKDFAFLSKEDNTIDIMYVDEDDDYKEKSILESPLQKREKELSELEKKALEYEQAKTLINKLNEKDGQHIGE